VFEAHEEVIWLAFVSRDQLVVASAGGLVRVLELGTDTCINLCDHLGEPNAFAMAPGNKLALSSTKAGDLIVWDAQTWTKQLTIEPSYTMASESLLSGSWLSFSPDSALVAAASDRIGASCEVWEIQSWKRIHQFQGYAQQIWGLQFSPDGSLLASASRDSTIRLWDLNVIGSPSQDTFITHLAMSPLGTIFATSSSDGTVEIREVESCKLLWAQSTGLSDKSSQAVIVMSPDDKYLALYETSDKDIRIFDLETGQLYAKLRGTFEGSVKDVLFRSDSRQVVMTDNRRTVELWDLESLTRV
jgi:WD40 repeat protein